MIFKLLTIELRFITELGNESSFVDEIPQHFYAVSNPAFKNIVVPLKQCVKCNIGIDEIDRFCRNCGWEQSKIDSKKKSEKFLSPDSDLRWHEKIIMNTYFMLKKISLSEESAFGLDSSSVKIEKFPMVLHPPEKITLNRVQ